MNNIKNIGTAKLILPDGDHELPIMEGSEGEKAIDISTLRKKTGYITMDSSYGNTGACTSAITYLDGERGILRYRGYPIEELAAHSTFVETAYLLLYGELPNKDELMNFSNILNESSLIHEDMRHFFDGFPNKAHPMCILSTMVAALAAFYPIPDELDHESELKIMANLISQVRTIAAFSFKKSRGEPVVYPSVKHHYVENFLNMMFRSPVHEYEADPDVVHAINLFLICHGDHEQNCSTSAVRMTSSSLANIYSAISSGICALWGPRHGGANQEVIQMLSRIHKQGGDGTEFIERAKSSTAERLMGFGHRVYKTFDPRAKILKQCCHQLLNKPGMSNPLFDIALKLEEVALSDEYFLSRNLYPNVDFYSGLILEAAKIPYNMFTVLFAMGRMPGWIAHWREQSHGDDFRISRPRQIYGGPEVRHYKAIDKRISDV